MPTPEECEAQLAAIAEHRKSTVNPTEPTFEITTIKGIPVQIVPELPKGVVLVGPETFELIDPDDFFD